ncbi:hypothetical protein ACFXK0_13605 [Nocardia sp. NPDC059177]|uniref:hypothetical protein n=1 Tax=Nocardia sp. NPDC059177 TaxID=3346759 RepID=UPI00369E64C6
MTAAYDHYPELHRLVEQLRPETAPAAREALLRLVKSGTPDRLAALFPLGAADASLIAVAERLQVQDIATADHHFRAVRTAGLDYINVVP